MYPTEYLAYGVGSSADVVIAPDAIKTYKVSDHLGSTRAEVVEGGTPQNWDYEPYGGAVAGDPPRKGFIDREEDKESGLGDFGVRKYDEDIGRFLSTDPLWEGYRAWSPYHYSGNSPVSMKDPEGKSGIAVINNEADEIVIHSKIYFYGDVTSEEAGFIASGIVSEWNRNGDYGKVQLNGKTYTVKFKMRYETVTEKRAKEIAASNTSEENNFVKVHRTKQNLDDRSAFDLGGNTGVFYLDDNLVDSKTAAHEYGHGLGLDHPLSNDQSGRGRPHIMVPRGSEVGQEYLYDPSKPYNRETNAMNPDTRTVKEKNIGDIFYGPAINQQMLNTFTKVPIGTANNNLD